MIWVLFYCTSELITSKSFQLLRSNRNDEIERFSIENPIIESGH